MSLQFQTAARERDLQDRSELAALGILEVLAQDPRPTLVLDLTLIKQTSQTPVVHRNPALRSHFALNELISGRVIGHSDLDYIEFRDWIVHQQESQQKWTRPSVRSFGGMSWTTFTVRSRYRVVSGVPEKVKDPDTSTSNSSPTARHLFPESMRNEDENDDGDSASLASTERYAFRCTDLSVPERRFSPFVQFFRSVDWSTTLLGNIDEWPLQLHQMVNFVMNDPTPAFVLWGKDLSVIYNEAAIQVLLDRHPRVMGLPLQEVYPEVWDQISILIHKVQRTGKAVRVEDVPMLLNRRGRMDECFFSFQYQPIADERGSCLGVYESFNDVTRQNHASRRMSLLLAISTCSSIARDIADFWRLLLEALDSSDALPFLMLYTTQDLLHGNVQKFDESGPNTPDSSRPFALEGQLGIPETHVTHVKELHLSPDAPGYGSAMNKANESGEPVYLSIEKGTLPAEFVEGIDLRSIQTPSNTVVVWPISPTGMGDTVAFIIMGINPHLGLDEELKSFLEIMQRQIATSAAAILLFEDEVRHREDVAKQLHLRTKELMKSELKFQRISDRSMVGIMTADLSGNIVYANQAFREITGHSGEDSSMSSWLDLFSNDVAALLKDVWIKLHTTREPIVAEFPLKKPWTKTLDSGETLKGSTWILLSAFLEEEDDGSTKGSLATITDISQQKWAEEHQTRRMEEAMELKRQQEAFVDMTSHEIRNPLSAIIQSADSISSSLATLFPSSSSPDTSHLLVPRAVLEDNKDAADTITLCAQHQQNVVNDILTLSKMDSDMLSVTPINVEPLKIIGHVVKMFESESIKHGIAVTVIVEPSFHELGLQTVRLDPSRLTQVLVNILGNALKFTRLMPEKEIQIRVGASLQDPSRMEKDIEYIPPNETTIPADFMNGSSTVTQLCFMRIAMKDTGPGLKKSERERLFKRFSQGSVRTEVEYGGSGLGLFISKRLSELQGGGIGLASEPGQGSTFAFYVLAQRLEKPKPLTTTDLNRQNEDIIKVAFPEHRSARLLIQPRPSPPVLTGAVLSNPSVAVAAIQRKLAILVVEDNLVNQRVLCKQLRNLGHIVYAANHGKEALEFLEKSTYWTANDGNGEHLDIILLDTEMPVMDGLTCARRIREAEREGRVNGHVPIISVSANARSEQIEIARSVGMDDAISKPFRVADLIPKMDGLVGNYGS